MIRPHIEYANQVMHSRHLQDVEKLDSVQKKATNIVIRQKINIWGYTKKTEITYPYIQTSMMGYNWCI